MDIRVVALTWDIEDNTLNATSWLDPLDLSNQKKLLDLVYICPRGTRDGMPYFLLGKSVFVKHTNAQSRYVLVPVYLVPGQTSLLPPPSYP